MKKNDAYCVYHKQRKESMIYKMISFFVLVGLLSLGAYAELHDPTRPPDDIAGDSTLMTTWQLNATIIAPNRKIAIINGQSIKIGEKIINNQLIDIKPNSVQLENANGR